MTLVSAKMLHKNLPELIERLGTTLGNVEANGCEWIETERLYFRRPIEFPDKNTLANWQKEERQDCRIRSERLLVLIAYLAVGRLREKLTEDKLEECKGLAKAARSAPDPKVFAAKFRLPLKPTDQGASIPMPTKTIDRLLSAAIGATTSAHKVVKAALESLERPNVEVPSPFEHLNDKTGGTILDKNAEHAAEKWFERPGKLGLADIHFEGDESIKVYDDDFGWRPDANICVLADGLDGMNLAEMGIPLWCSAIVVFSKTTEQILCAAVHLAQGKLCVARIDVGEPGAWVARNRTSGLMPKGNAPLGGPLEHKSLHDARIAFYGQKPKSFLSLADGVGFKRLLNGIEAKVSAEEERLDFRLYNFAGNPILVKLVDRRPSRKSRTAMGIDLVAELRGQYPQDFVPGAYIALKMGAYLCDEYGIRIREKELVGMLLHPRREYRYVAAGSKRLAEDFLNAIGS